MSCHEKCIGCVIEEEPHSAFDQFFYGYAQALSHGAHGLGEHIDIACPKHKALMKAHIEKILKFVGEHAVELEKQTVN